MADMIPCRHEVTGHACEFPEEPMPTWRGLGWKPISEWPADPEPEAESPEPAAEEPPTRPVAKRATKIEEQP